MLEERGLVLIDDDQLPIFGEPCPVSSITLPTTLLQKQIDLPGVFSRRDCWQLLELQILFADKNNAEVAVPYTTFTRTLP